MDRAILHVDMDAFYAAVEVLDNPDLRGRPVIVGGTPEGHGVVSTASYEARRYGIHSAMPAAAAVRLCPHGVFLPVRMRRYAAVSRQVMGVLRSFTPLVEPISIDEAFLDVTDSRRLEGTAAEIARKIKERVRETTGGLTASVGVASNKFLAKVASDLEKPDGLVVVPPDGAEAFLAPLPISKLWGVGPKTAEALHAVGYYRIADLQGRPEAALVASLGDELGRHIYRLAHGIDSRTIETHREARSISSETTLAEFLDPDDRAAVDRLLLGLSEDVATRLRRGGTWGQTVTIKVRDDRFSTCTRSRRVSTPVQLTDEIYAVARKLFRERIDLAGRRLRLLGVAVSNLSADQPVQLDLFEAEERDRADRLAATVDSIRERLGRAAIVRGPMVDRPSAARDPASPRADVSGEDR